MILEVTRVFAVKLDDEPHRILSIHRVMRGELLDGVVPVVPPLLDVSTLEPSQQRGKVI